jgi:Response regulator containing CheY-like receiver, AAA-type ATPase, and DNA-binding domains
VIEVPPLRARPEDVDVLARAFLRELAAGMGAPEPALSERFLAALRARPWPGNARELRAALQSALLWWDGVAPLAPGDLVEAFGELFPGGGDGRLAEQMLAAWRAAGGNQEAARRALGLSRAAWRHRWERLGVDGPRGRGA